MLRFFGIIKSMEEKPAPFIRKVAKKSILPLAALLVLTAWLLLTPAGLMGKADAIGYAVCHQIPVRSFHLGDRPLPLCARCSGMHLGALLGLVYLSRFKRRGGLPSLKVSIVLGIFALAFLVDGTNSYFHLYPNFSGIYEPHNWLRLITGTGLGLGIAAVLYPVFNQTIWADWEDTPALKSWRQLGILLALSTAIDLALVSENPLLLYPLALLSAGNVLLLLGLVYTVVWILIFKRENRYHSFKDISGMLLAGFTTALVQIAIMDYGRFWLTGTWAGFFS
jgi:uncharacterized membrane protein